MFLGDRLRLVLTFAEITDILRCRDHPLKVLCQSLSIRLEDSVPEKIGLIRTRRFLCQRNQVIRFVRILRGDDGRSITMAISRTSSITSWTVSSYLTSVSDLVFTRRIMASSASCSKVFSEKSVRRVTGTLSSMSSISNPL